MRALYAVVDSSRKVLVVAVMGFIVAVGGLQIFLRYIPGLTPMSWADEIMRYLNIWVVFLAASIGVKESTHLQMDYFLTKFFPERTIRIIKKVSNVLIIAGLLLLIWFGALRVLENSNALIQSLPISISFFYAAIPVGCLLILFDYTLILIHGEHPFASRAASNTINT